MCNKKNLHTLFMSWIRSSAHLERGSEGDMGKRVVGAVPPSFRLNKGHVRA